MLNLNIQLFKKMRPKHLTKCNNKPDGHATSNGKEYFYYLLCGFIAALVVAFLT